MSVIESLRVALESLAANRLRSALTMIGIIIGVGSVIAITAIGRGTRDEVMGELNGMSRGIFQIAPKPPDPNDPSQRLTLMTDTDLSGIRTLLPDIESAITVLPGDAVVRLDRKTVRTQIIGTSNAAPNLLGIVLEQGRWFTLREEESGERVVILASDTVKTLMGENATNPVGRSLFIGGYPFEVIGVTARDTGFLARNLAPDQQAYYVPLEFVRRVTGIRHVTMVMAKVKDGADTEQVMKDAIALIERNHRGAKFEGTNFTQFTEVIGRVASIITGVLAAVAGISLVVGGVGIMNIMLVSVTERTREIGIRKAIGASYRDVLMQFLIEATLLSSVGGGVGLLLAALPVWLIGRWMKISLLLDVESILLALGVSIGVGILFGVYPAAKAARLHPIDALRYE